MKKVTLATWTMNVLLLAPRKSKPLLTYLLSLARNHTPGNWNPLFRRQSLCLRTTFICRSCETLCSAIVIMSPPNPINTLHFRNQPFSVPSFHIERLLTVNHWTSSSLLQLFITGRRSSSRSWHHRGYNSSFWSFTFHTGILNIGSSHCQKLSSLRTF
jgi:hypothetical protein